MGIDDDCGTFDVLNLYITESITISISIFMRAYLYIFNV